MQQKQLTILAIGAIGGFVGLIAIALIAYLAITAVQREAEKTREVIVEAKESVPLSGVGKTVNETISRGQSLADEIIDSVGEKVDSPEDLVGEMFKTGQQFSKKFDKIGQDLMKLKPEEVRSIGAELHRGIKTNLQLKDGLKDKERLTRLAEPFLKNRGKAVDEISFHIVVDNEVNAFAHLGGYVYLTTGLLDFANSERELQFVLGHEIAHVKLGHCESQMTYSAQASKLAGDLGAHVVQLGYKAIALGYSEDQEYEADELSCRESPESRKGAIEFLSRLKQVLRDREHDDSVPMTGFPASDILIKELSNHFATHPPTDERIERLKTIK